MILRRFAVEEAEMPQVGRRSKQVIEEQFPDVTWEHSHVVVDDNGTVSTYCVYAAPDEETVWNHAKALGRHEVQFIQEIAGDVSPADFPL
jgi:hypothetical protein